MVFDLSFLSLELTAADTGAVSNELLDHPAFRAIADHEAELGRPVWDKESFLNRFVAAKAKEKGLPSWGLAPLFQDRARLEELRTWLETEGAALTERIDTWLSRFTAVPQRPDLRCVPYVGSYDAGFSPNVGSGTIYLNLPVLPSRESFLETLVHESYHARAVNEKTARRCRAIEADPDPITQLLYITAEEGAANLVGYNGSMTTEHPVIPLRTPEEGTAELKQLLTRYESGELTGQDTLNAFLQTDCCYTGGSYLACSVWESLGRDGLELWSAQGDLWGYYTAFRSAPQGADWPDLLKK